MDKRVKFSFKQKHSVVKSIVAGTESHGSAARKLGCAKQTVSQWLRLFRLHGSEGLCVRNGTYTGKFKVRVVQVMLKHHLSLKEVAARFAVPRAHTVGRWLEKFNRLGTAGLLYENRGRKKVNKVAKKVRKTQTSGMDPSVEKIAALEKELAYLRAENALLKKLKALVQQEKAGKVRDKR
jgi:transposase